MVRCSWHIIRRPCDRSLFFHADGPYLECPPILFKFNSKKNHQLEIRLTSISERPLALFTLPLFRSSADIPARRLSLDESPGGHCADPDFYSLHMVCHFSRGCFNCVLWRAVSQHLQIIPCCHIGRLRTLMGYSVHNLYR